MYKIKDEEFLNLLIEEILKQIREGKRNDNGDFYISKSKRYFNK